MDAVILAAGLGMRLNPLTDAIPKCLAPVNGKAILRRQIESLSDFPLQRLHVVLGYKHAQAATELQNLETPFPVSILLNTEFEKTNNMVSLHQAARHVRGKPFLLLNGDVLFEKKLMQQIWDREDAVCPYDSTNFDPEELKLLIEDGRAAKIMPKITGPEGSQGATIGIFKFSGAASEWLFEDMEKTILSGKRNEWFEYSLSHVFAQTVFAPLDVAGLRWVEIDNPEDLALAEKVFD